MPAKSPTSCSIPTVMTKEAWSRTVGSLHFPEPTKGDLFFDIEGARYYTEDNKEYGLQYLFGIVDTADLDADGTPVYTQIWTLRSGRREDCV